MKRTVLFFLFFNCFISMQSQNLRANKIVVDKKTKFPLENVSIYNNKDNSITNEEGLFVFVSDNNEINFSLLGYNSLKMTFDDLKLKDTIFMEVKAINLDEIMVSDARSIIKKAHENSNKNYSSSSYTENFFLRYLLKKSNEVIRLQDIFGKMFREKMFNNDPKKTNVFAIEILNLRKIGIVDKNDITYFEFPSLNTFLQLSSSILFNSKDYYDFTEMRCEDDNYRKINFVLKEKNETNQKISGYFLINKEDYSIKHFFLDFYDDVDSIPYQEKKGHKFRTSAYKVSADYSKDLGTNKYYLSNANLEAKVEILGDSRIQNATYDFIATLLTTKSFTNDKVVSNFSVDKDIFKAKFPYNEEFWRNQNQLPLTQELKNFLKRVTENKDKKKEFEIIGNF